RSVPVASDRLLGESRVEEEMSLFGVIASVVKRGEHAVEDGAKVFGGALDRAARGAGHVAKNVAEQDVKGVKEIGHTAAKVGRTIGNVVEHMSPSDIGHTVLDLVGMVPVVGTVANLVNAGWYAAQGDWTDAAWSAAAAIPIGGEAADAAKLVKDGVKLGED